MLIVKIELGVNGDTISEFTRINRARLRLMRVSLMNRYKKIADKTQEEVAQAMKTTKSAVSCLESGGGSKRHMPSLNTIKRYAEAVGCRLQIKLIPKKKHA